MSECLRPKLDKMKINFPNFWNIFLKWPKSEEKPGELGWYLEFSPPPLGNPSYATASADLLVFLFLFHLSF